MIINQIIHFDMRKYPTNLTENQWQFIKKIIENNRKRKHTLRSIFDSILYLIKTGCQWRMLPNNFAPWNTVYFYYRKWKNEGVFEELLDYVRNEVRKQAGKDESPSAANIHDSQSAYNVISNLKWRFSRLKKIFADGGYRGELIGKVYKSFGWIIDIVLRSDSNKSFEILPKRWVIERTFA